MKDDEMKYNAEITTEAQWALFEEIHKAGIWLSPGARWTDNKDLMQLVALGWAQGCEYDDETGSGVLATVGHEGLIARRKFLKKNH